MLINNVDIINREDNLCQIEINNSKITSVRNMEDNEDGRNNEMVINFENAIAFPGLINSHDHLEFNLYPQLGNKKYIDYIEWGEDIHEKNREQIEAVKKIPYDIRYKWGLYKNLLCGITTVAHHGNGAVIPCEVLPDIITDYNYLHSIRLEKHWKLKLNLLTNSFPFVVHVGEGTNAESHKEINDLLKWNIFRKNIIAVHGIALDEQQSRKLNALIWCPDSNFFLYNKTADIPALKKNTSIVFGSDSTVSADWNFWNHIRLARQLNFLSDDELYEAITTSAAKIWGLNSKGSIAENYTADLVVSKKKSANNRDSFYDTNPEDILLILKNGRIVFVDKDLSKDFKEIDQSAYGLISINSVHKLVIKGLSELVSSIHHYIPQYNFPFTLIQ